MPQGSLLGPLTFIVLIDDLNTDCMIHKFVDDTTLSEFIDKGQASQMDVNVTQLLNWSSNNHMNVNFKKTKEMIINTSHCNFLDKLSVFDVEIERVNVFKLLGGAVAVWVASRPEACRLSKLQGCGFESAPLTSIA